MDVDYYPPPAAAPVETSWTATIALILAILALIIIIVVAVFAFRDINVISEIFDIWTVQTSLTTSPDSFTAAPNSIFSINPGLMVPLTVTIVPFANIATVITTGRTTLFKIDNISSNQNITVTPPSGGFAPRAANAPNPALVSPGTTATYMWTTTTQVKRLT